MHTPQVADILEVVHQTVANDVKVDISSHLTQSNLEDAASELAVALSSIGSVVHQGQNYIGSFSGC